MKRRETLQARKPVEHLWQRLISETRSLTQSSVGRGSKGINICMLSTNCLEGRTHCSKKFAPLSLHSVIALHEKKGESKPRPLPTGSLPSALSSHQNTSWEESGSLHGSVSAVGFKDKQMLGESVGSPWQAVSTFLNSIWEEALSRLSISESSSGGFLLKMF